MGDELDILIKGCRLRGRGEAAMDIGIRNGRIQIIETQVRQAAAATIEARENLATESFVNPHLHLDKVFTLTQLDDSAMVDYQGDSMSKSMTAIERAADVKQTYDREVIVEHVRKVLGWAAANGNTHIRAFADVDNQAKLVGIEALIQAREEFKGTVELQVVAFPQDGVVREPGAANLVREAMKLGADLVGGIPWIEYTEADARSHIDQMFEIALEFEAGVSMLVDDAGDPGLRTLEMMAVKTLETGWHGKVLAHHARAMALYPTPYFQKLAALLKQAEIAVVSDPHTGPLHARVSELRQEGVVVCLGQDDISDAYYPYGQNNMLEVAFLASHLLWMTTQDDMEVLYDIITTDAATAMGIQDHSLEVGSPANLVVLRQPDLLEALRFHQPPMAVISGGKLLDEIAPE